MATAPSPRTWAVGELLTAAKLNVDLRDGLNFLLAPPLAVLRPTSAQSGLTAGGYTALQFAAEDIDSDGGHSNVTNNTRYTSQTAGWYQCSGTAGINGNFYGIAIRKNGTTLNGGPLTYASGQDLRGGVMAILFLNVSDYVETVVFANNTGPTFFNDNMPRMEIRWTSK